MAGSVAVLSSTSTNTRKRKLTGGISDERNKDAKRPRRTLDAFFSPQVTATNVAKDDKGVREAVTLNDEQQRVLHMAVDEEKSVFFTGAAGACARPP